MARLAELGIEVIDAHAHIFPPRLFAALRRWFDTYAWPCIYEADSELVDGRLQSFGVARYLGLHYPHKPGMARELNLWAKTFCEQHPLAIFCASVFPGEEGAEEILQEALEGGARAIKLHSHVQAMPPDDARIEPIFGLASEYEVPIVFHCGDAPALSGYSCDPRVICTTTAIRRALQRFPPATVIVPHLGATDFDGVAALLGEFPQLYLDTSMAIESDLGFEANREGLLAIADRLLFGTDFPNIPHSWSCELEALLGLGFSELELRMIFAGNARRLFKIDGDEADSNEEEIHQESL